MGTPTANVSRNTFDANKSYRRMLLQQGVPLTDADINELQDNLDWWWSRSFDTLIGFDTNQVTVDDALYEFVHPVDPTKTWPADAPVVAATPTSWFPGSMRPWVHTAGLSNDYYVMWGPSWVQGLFVEDNEQRGPAGLYASAGHIITQGTVTALPGGTTFEDDSKDFTPATGSLHLTAPAGGVGNGTDRHARVRFVTGPEAGNTYVISAVPTSARLTVTGPYSAGGPLVGNEYVVLPNTIVFVNGQVEKVWLGVWVEDQDMAEDPALLEPTMLLEPSHRLRVRYFHRIFRSGANLPSTADRPDYPDVAPQSHEEKIYWVLLATITPGAGAPTIVPADIVYATPGHFELAPLGPLTQTLKSLLDLGSGKWKDIRFADDVGPGASLAANQHAIIRTSPQGVRFPALANNDLSSVLDLDWWTGAAARPFLDVMGWKNASFAGGIGTALLANALISKSGLAGSDGLLYVGVSAEEITASLTNFLNAGHLDAKAWIKLFADDAGGTADFLSELSLHANWSQDGVRVGHLSMGLYPNDGDNQAHTIRANLALEAGADTPMSYLFHLVAPSGVTDGWAGMKIEGPTGAGTHTIQGEVALHVLNGDVKFGTLGSPQFFWDDSANLLTLVGGITAGGAGAFATLGVSSTALFTGLATFAAGIALQTNTITYVVPETFRKVYPAARCKEYVDIALDHGTGAAAVRRNFASETPVYLKNDGGNGSVNATEIFIPIDVPDGASIASIAIWGQNRNASSVIEVALYEAHLDGSDTIGAVPEWGAYQTFTEAVNVTTYERQSKTPGSPLTLNRNASSEHSSKDYYIAIWIENGAGAGDARVAAVGVTYTMLGVYGGGY